MTRRDGIWSATVRVRLAVVAAEAQRVADWVEEHAYVFLRLVLGQRRSERNRLGNRGVEVVDLEVEVHHRTLLAVHGGQTGTR